jgi:hypothetical protein
MVYFSSEAYGEKGYKWRNHLFYTPVHKIKKYASMCPDIE